MRSRTMIAEIARGLVGAEDGNAKHQYIVNTYNAYNPKPRGYKMKMSDPWCACTVSVVAILAGYTDIIPIEVSCSRMIKLMKSMGIYEGNDDLQNCMAGDIIFYKWNAKSQEEDNGADGVANHVGIILSNDLINKRYEVFEGNMKCADGKYRSAIRYIPYGWKEIQGFGLPKYTEGQTESKQYYVVKTGDTLNKIARAFGYKDYRDLLPLNPEITNPNRIYPKQKVRVR